MVMGRKKIDVRENYISVHLWLLAKFCIPPRNFAAVCKTFGRKDSWLTFVFLESKLKVSCKDLQRNAKLLRANRKFLRPTFAQQAHAIFFRGKQKVFKQSFLGKYKTFVRNAKFLGQTFFVSKCNVSQKNASFL